MFVRNLFIACVTIVCSFAITTTASAISIQINERLSCEFDDALSLEGIVKVNRRGQKKYISFKVARRIAKRATRKIRRKIQIARKRLTGKRKRKVIRRLRKKMSKRREAVKAVKRCKSGALIDSIPEQSPTATPDPDTGTTFRSLSVDSNLSLFIDPGLGFSQYYGAINFTDVVALSPRGIPVPEKIAIAARSACLNNWDEQALAGIAAVRMTYFDPEKMLRFNINSPSFWFPETGGVWTSQGSNGQSGIPVTATAGYWDRFYNRARRKAFISTKYNGNMIAIECFVNPSVDIIYP